MRIEVAAKKIVVSRNHCISQKKIEYKFKNNVQAVLIRRLTTKEKHSHNGMHDVRFSEE